MPLPIVAGLAFFRSIDAEQSHELGSEFHGIAVDDLEPWLSGPNHSVVIGLRSCGEATMRASRTRTHIAGSRHLNRWPERDLRCFLVTVGRGGGAGPVTPRNSRTDSSLIPTPIMAAKGVSDMRLVRSSSCCGSISSLMPKSCAGTSSASRRWVADLCPYPLLLVQKGDNTRSHRSCPVMANVQAGSCWHRCSP